MELIKIAQASSTTPPNDATPTPFLFPADILAELKDITRVRSSIHMRERVDEWYFRAECELTHLRCVGRTE